MEAYPYTIQRRDGDGWIKINGRKTEVEARVEAAKLKIENPTWEIRIQKSPH